MKKILMLSGAIMAITAASNATAVDVDVSAKVQFTAIFGNELHDVNGDNAFDPNTSTVPLYSDDESGDIESWDTDADLTFTASHNTCCLDYGIRINLDIDPDATDTGDYISDVDAKLYVNTQYGKIELGEVDASQAAFDQSFMDVGPLNGDKDVSVPYVSTAGAALMSDNNHKFESEIPPSGIAFYVPVGPLTVGASINASDNMVLSVKGAYELAGYGISGVAAFAGDTYAAQLQTEIMGVKIGGTMGEDGDNEEYYGGGLGYEMGALSFSGTAMMATGFAQEITAPSTNFEAEELDLTFGMDYKLSSGLVVDASIQSSKRITKASPANVLAASNESWTQMGIRIAATF